MVNSNPVTELFYLNAIACTQQGRPTEKVFKGLASQNLNVH